MTIHIVRGERELKVFDALLQIARCDPGLITYSVGLSLYVDYAPKQASTKSSKRLLDLTSNTWPIHIAGVGSGYTNTVNGKPIIKSGGAITLPYATQTNIFVDVEDAFGQHYRDIDVDRKTIYSPLPAILYHELAHAYHEAIAHDAPPDVAGKEVQARKDENEFRDQLKLPLEHPTDYWSNDVGMPSHGGVKFVTCQASGGYSNPWANKCIIATAALGSPGARQIVAFRRAQRDFEELTFGSAPILAPMLNAYELFGPRVAGAMYADPKFRDAVLHFGVQPATHLLRIVESYLSTAPGARLDGEIGRVVAEYAGTVPAVALADAAADASVASRSLAGRAAEQEGVAGSVFSPIAAAALRSGADTAGPAWVLDGLAQFLHEAASRTGQLAIGEWLARCPFRPERASMSSGCGRNCSSCASACSRTRRAARSLRDVCWAAGRNCCTVLEETGYTESQRVRVHR